MKLVLAYFKAETLALLRYPWFLVGTVPLPSLLFLFIGIPVARQSPALAAPLMASFALLGVLSITFFQFGVGISNDRISPWEVYVRTLPVSPLTRFTARLLSGLLFAAAAVGIVIILGLVLTPARLSIGQWAAFLLAVLLGSIPFAFFGITIGYWVPAKAAPAVANIVYLVLAFAGGLLLAPQSLPSIIAPVSRYLPTGMYGELASRAVLGKPWSIDSWIGLLAYTLLFAALAVWGYKRGCHPEYCVKVERKQADRDARRTPPVHGI